jgi:hypothetical protein
LLSNVAKAGSASYTYHCIGDDAADAGWVLKLHNPGTKPAHYSINWFNGSGTNVFTETNQTLNAKAFRSDNVNLGERSAEIKSDKKLLVDGLAVYYNGLASADSDIGRETRCMP